MSSTLVILGFLLTLSALLGAGVSARVRSRAGRFLISPIDPATWSSLGAIIAGFFVEVAAIAALVSAFSAGGSLLVVGIGVVVLGLGIETSRFFARIERRRVAIGDLPALRAHAYLPYGEGAREVLTAVFLDLNRWRDVVYVFVAFPLAVLELTAVVVLWAVDLALLSAPFLEGFELGLPPEAGGQQLAVIGQADLAVTLLAMVAGVALLPVAASATQGILALHRAVVAGLLCESDQKVLRRRVETLEGSRRAALDAEASELRRIERDLHDGAQQRLVVLAMNLGLAADRIESDPERAKAMVLEARDQARTTLAELRDLVRGIAPSILVDRGLVPAIESLAGRTPVPTMVTGSLPEGRLPEAVERAAYFVAAESLANVAKHAVVAHAPPTATGDRPVADGPVPAPTTPRGATRCDVRCRVEGGNLVIEVIDDGPGGARVAPTGGLAGLAGRVGALDGTLTVTSPEGGPTVVRAVIPVAEWGPIVPSGSPGHAGDPSSGTPDRVLPGSPEGWR